ncbi:MAG: hypothetical protein K0U98_07505 [Deltaproteobacteria bacterium]|nr:hypothetical protein [Deltaproteobacteria bacterium]
MKTKPALSYFSLLFLGTILLTVGSPSEAQPASQQPTGLEVDPLASNEVVATLEGETRPRIPLAFPATSLAPGMSSRGEQAARELESTLRSDLDATRIFDIQGPEALAVLKLSGDSSRDLEQYRSLGNDILLLTDVRDTENKVIFEGRLLDLKNGDSILGKRYQGTFDIARSIAHTFSDEVMLYLGGRRGIARTSIAFTSDRTGHKEIYLMDYDGHGQRQVTAHKSISMAPTWSGDSSNLAYLSFLKGPPSLLRVDLSTGKKNTLVSDGKHNLSPSYSPDNRSLAFAKSLDGNTEIFAARSGGSQERRLTHSRSIETNPAWSPTGQGIAFTSSRTGNPNIFIMDPDGANIRRISFDGTYNDGAAWHPEGSRIAYSSRRGGVFQIVVTDIVTLETTVLTKGSRNKEGPTFSPDGERIAFSSQGREGSQIYVVDLEGRVLAQLTHQGNNSSPSWSPYPAKNR